MSQKNIKCLAIIPAYNEQETVGMVVDKIFRELPGATVLVVNDCSTDDTSIVARQAGALVIDLPQNLGIGGAMQTGYIYAFVNDFDIAFQIDADGQHPPEELHKLLLPLLSNEADMILGSRYVEKTRYESTFSRRLGMVILSFLISIFARQKIMDTTSGFRGINRNIIKIFAKEYSTDYPEVDALVLIKKNGFRIKEISVEMKQRLGGQSSITPIKSAYYMIKVSLSLLIRSLR